MDDPWSEPEAREEVSFFAGLFVGAFGTYAFLLYQCQRAAERFRETVQDEINRA